MKRLSRLKDFVQINGAGRVVIEFRAINRAKSLVTQYWRVQAEMKLLADGAARRGPATASSTTRNSQSRTKVHQF